MINRNYIPKTESISLQYTHVVEQTGQEIAWRHHWISTDALRKQIERQKSSYYAYVRKVMK